MEYQNILVGMAFVLLFSLFSKPIEKTVLIGPFLALFVGLLLGPRGLATLVFAIIVSAVELPHSETLILTAARVVMLSVGSAKPFINGPTLEISWSST